MKGKLFMPMETAIRRRDILDVADMNESHQKCKIDRRSLSEFLTPKLQHVNVNGTTETWSATPLPLGPELRTSYQRFQVCGTGILVWPTHAFCWRH